jgi:hypothetical protein
MLKPKHPIAVLANDLLGMDEICEPDEISSRRGPIVAIILSRREMAQMAVPVSDKTREVIQSLLNRQAARGL